MLPFSSVDDEIIVIIVTNGHDIETVGYDLVHDNAGSCQSRNHTVDSLLHVRHNDFSFQNCMWFMLGYLYDI